MKILLTGGGSGGHIAPILAVARELKRSMPSCRLIYVGQRGDGLIDIVREHPAIDVVELVSAGKLRRYSGEGWRQLLDVRTQALNVRDVQRTVRGVWQAYRLLKKHRPNVVFTRGGFVSVPVALAAKLRGVPYITHDADSLPSLANRLIAPWAATHIVALPPEIYPYPPEKTQMLGIPADPEYRPVDAAAQAAFRTQLGLNTCKWVVLVTGGGNGARRLNLQTVANTRYLLSRYPGLVIVHTTGRALEAETVAAYDALDLGKARERVRVYGFVTDFYRYSGAADVIVARGGMSSLNEFALQHKACLLVPSKQLSWNVKNSRALAERGAVRELSEDHAEQPERLGRTIGALLDDEAERRALGAALAPFGRPSAAADIAAVIQTVGKAS
jgi:UDP-N-acetylglucosamine--N-acetylmuramyl-(pentapeptide) pyrophosphoryl-undecaprenol N-acetylglucosamine transferase